MSSVVAAVGCALAQIGSCDMSIRAGLGAAPSNFTVPFNDAASPAGRAATQLESDNNITRTHVGINVYLNFISNLPSCFLFCLRVTKDHGTFTVPGFRSLLPALLACACSWKCVMSGYSALRPTAGRASWQSRMTASECRRGRSPDRETFPGPSLHT